MDVCPQVWNDNERGHEAGLEGLETEGSDEEGDRPLLLPQDRRLGT